MSKTFTVEFTEADVWLWKALERDVNRTAYHGGLGLAESGKYLSLIDRITTAYEKEYGSCITPPNSSPTP